MLLLVHYPQDFTLDKSELDSFFCLLFLQSRLMFINNQRCLLFPRKKKTFYLLTWKNQRINTSFFFQYMLLHKSNGVITHKENPRCSLLLAGVPPHGKLTTSKYLLSMHIIRLEKYKGFLDLSKMLVWDHHIYLILPVTILPCLIFYF